MPPRTPRHLAEHRLPWRLMLVAFGLTVSITKRVGIGAVAGAVVLIAMGIWLTDSLDEKLFAITLGLIVIVRHHQNLRDLVASRHPKD